MEDVKSERIKILGWNKFPECMGFFEKEINSKLCIPLTPGTKGLGELTLKQRTMEHCPQMEGSLLLGWTWSE